MRLRRRAEAPPPATPTGRAAETPVTGRALQVGDILSLNTFPMISGYYTALERTMFVREVDAAGGACLLVRRAAWDALGGFADACAPACFAFARSALRAASSSRLCRTRCASFSKPS